MIASAPSSWWTPERHADRRPWLAARARALGAVRALFAAEGSTEVDVGALTVQPGAELHVEALPTRHGWLHTSPELAMKKLLAAGETHIFHLGKCYRAGETGPLHLPEFTLLEWYRAGETFEAVVRDALGVLAAVADSCGARRLAWRGAVCDPFSAPERLTVASAFQRHAGIDILATLSDDGEGDAGRLAAAAHEAGFATPPGEGWSDLFSRLLVALVEPHLGLARPTVLCDYPAPEAALSVRSAGDPRIARRFEVYACGVELANGFDELTDPVEQRRRFETLMAERVRIGARAWPIDEAFLEALAHMPPAAGCALGFDRLLTLACGAPRIVDVVWAPPPGVAS